jgi:lipoprotein-anchoring transpeptidase ErfK/SrfK
MSKLGNLTAILASAAGLFLLGSAAPPRYGEPAPAAAAERLDAAAPAEQAQAILPAPPPLPEPPPPPPPPPPPTAEEALEDGVLIVVSIPDQRLIVLKDGETWASSKVSTGRRGHETPVGTFPILQKKVHHRSNLYDDAPMPYMQRLTWDGVALHAGNVPGYPASHGCIRLPRAFAKKLYGVTGFQSTVVVVTDEPIGSAKDVRKLI